MTNPGRNSRSTRAGRRKHVQAAPVLQSKTVQRAMLQHKWVKNESRELQMDVERSGESVCWDGLGST
ncbi:hypothetical protein PABG_01917 [Paracoccidioides brasiliensis Pb03]|nr:hypothetical protein PABG_01917 [Paracoccidioides brasiliensis Pb03]